MTDVNILKIDEIIQNRFNQNKINIDEYKTKLKELEELLELTNISQITRDNIIVEKEMLKTKIEDIDSNTSFNFYLIESLPYIVKYKKILDTPIKISFVKTCKDTEKIKQSKIKKQIIKNYLNVANKYIDLKFQENICVNDNIECEVCGNTNNFDILDNNYICIECGTIQEKEYHNTSFNDVERINISTKYTYVRKAHFKDCMNQYQGKQNCNIEDKIYKELIEEFKNHDLLLGDENSPKEIRFKNIEKFHVLNFIKELGYTNHYENTIYIHSKLTGKPADDITHLENKLMNDFITLEKLYYIKYKNNSERKSFINTNHIFYQLLRKHKHKCNKEDFSLLKTIDRQDFHDEICEDLFKTLGWNYISFY